MSKKFIIVVNLVLAFVFFAGMASGMYYAREAIKCCSLSKLMLNVTAAKYPTGYDVLDEINKYRHELGKPDLILYEPLCNNLAVRWLNYNANNSHKGLQEHVNTYMPGMQVSEILAPGKTAKEMVQNWKGSPGHDIIIKNSSRICVYSAEGLSVALLSK